MQGFSATAKPCVLLVADSVMKVDPLERQELGGNAGGRFGHVRAAGGVGRSCEVARWRFNC